MTAISKYFGPATSSGAPTWWCRPKHKMTCTIAIYCSSCCVCIPTTATCFIIEMWGQGGNGGSGCCCGVGSYGGQGGSYGWVTCTTSGTNHILCACTCSCVCSCNTCNGAGGRHSVVVQCNAPSNVWCVQGGGGGIWCCSPSGTWCWEGSNGPNASSCKYNTWLFFKNNASLLNGTTTTATPTTLLSQCESGGTVFTPTATAYTQCQCQIAASSILNTNQLWPCLCTCSCFNSPYVWVGGCGWSDPGLANTPFGCLNNVATGVVNSYFCGGGGGVGGASYAGGDQAWHQGFFSCGYCYVQNGNTPGGGGMSQHTQTAQSQGAGGCGAVGLILISYC